MRTTLLLACALPLLLTACGSSSRQESAAASPVGAYARPAFGSGQVRGDFASYPAAGAFVDRMAGEGFDQAQVADWLSRAERQQWIIDFVHRPVDRGLGR